PALLDAAGGYFGRRGLPGGRGQVVAAPGAALLLLALSAAVGGDVLLPRPCAAWWAPGDRLLGRGTFHVPTPAECGGVPDPYALLETVRRVRAEGGDPRLVVLSVADDPTGTVPPPELLHETVEAAAGEGLHVVADETWRDTVHGPAESAGSAGRGVLISPAEMLPEWVTVLADLSGAFLPGDWPAAVARFPDTAPGADLRARALDVLTALGAVVAAPVAAAAGYALGEPDEVTARLAAATRLHARVADAAYRAVRAVGGHARPPRAGCCLYADLGPLQSAFAARAVTDAIELEDYLTERLGMPVAGGHRFGDDLGGLRVRLSTGPLIGATDRERLESLAAQEPLESPYVRRALALLGSALDELRADTATATTADTAATAATATTKTTAQDAQRREPPR
ncbi:aminotransferase class I/II-fold pyridoxal phosphate-dependent enzyme, partial [Streptomyces sp. O3]